MVGGRWTGRAGFQRAASGPAEHICSYVMPVLLTGKDKEESRTKAVPTVAMAVSKPPSLIPPIRLRVGAAAEAVWFWLRTSPRALVLLSRRGSSEVSISQRGLPLSLARIYTHVHTHSCTRTPRMQSWLGRCLSPRGLPGGLLLPSLPTALLAR